MLDLDTFLLKLDNCIFGGDRRQILILGRYITLVLHGEIQLNLFGLCQLCMGFGVLMHKLKNIVSDIHRQEKNWALNLAIIHLSIYPTGMRRISRNAYGSLILHGFLLFYCSNKIEAPQTELHVGPFQFFLLGSSSLVSKFHFVLLTCGWCIKIQNSFQ